MRARNCDVCGKAPTIRRDYEVWLIRCESKDTPACALRFIYSHKPRAKAIRDWNSMIAEFKADDQKAA